MFELVAEYIEFFVFTNVTMKELCASNSNHWVCVNLSLAVNFCRVQKGMKKGKSKLSKLFVCVKL